MGEDKVTFASLTLVVQLSRIMTKKKLFHAQSLASCRFDRDSLVKLYEYRYEIRCPGHILNPAPPATINGLTDIWALDSLQSRLLAIVMPPSPPPPLFFFGREETIGETRYSFTLM